MSEERSPYVVVPPEGQRIKHFERWWEGGFPVLLVTPEFEQRLAVAFSAVFTSMPEEHLQLFLQDSPTIFCVEGVRGAAACLWSMSPTPAPTPIAIICLDSASLSRGTDASLRNTVAHECAHVVLGHHKRRGLREGADAESEAAADALSVSWGFRAAAT